MNSTARVANEGAGTVWGTARVPGSSSAKASPGLTGWPGLCRRGAVARGRYLLAYLCAATVWTCYDLLACGRGGELFKVFVAGAAMVFVKRHVVLLCRGGMCL